MEKHLLITISIQELKDIIQDVVRSELERNQKTSIQAQPNKTEYLSRNQVAKILGISLPTLGKYIKDGLIPASRLSKRVLIERKDLENSLTKIRTIKYSRAISM